MIRLQNLVKNSIFVYRFWNYFKWVWLWVCVEIKPKCMLASLIYLYHPRWYHSSVFGYWVWYEFLPNTNTQNTQFFGIFWVFVLSRCPYQTQYPSGYECMVDIKFLLKVKLKIFELGSFTLTQKILLKIFWWVF